MVNKSFRTHALVFFSLVLVIGSAELTSAGIITYTLTTSGTHSGSLGGQSFSNATISFSGNIDSTQVNTSAATYAGISYPMKYASVLTTVDVTIVDTSIGTVNTSLVAETGYNWAVFAILLAGAFGDEDTLGFAQIDSGGTLYALNNYGGSTSVGDTQGIYNSFAVAASYSTNYSTAERTISTTSGSLTFTGDAAQGMTINAVGSGGGTVPEPSTAMAMGLLGIVGFASNRRRRRQVSPA